MKEIYDLRINNDYANLVLKPEQGKKTDLVRIFKIDGSNPQLKTIEKVYRDLKKNCGECLFFGWSIDRKYTQNELTQANLFLLKITSAFEPEGEENGTQYNDAEACPKCGAGAPQVTPLYLPEKRIPKSKDICRTIAGEVVVSRRIKELFVRHDITGAKLLPIYYNRKSSMESKDWFQLIVTGVGVEVALQSWIGLGLFQEDIKDQFHCSSGDTIGLNLVSELFVKKSSVMTCDITATRQFFGARQGVLRPERKILISSRLYWLLESEKVKGYNAEVVRLVDEEKIS